MAKALQRKPREWIIPTLYPVAGIDEAGRGPLAGPVVAAAVVLPAEFDAGRIDDSKALGRETREELAVRILNSAEVGIGIASHEDIDATDILRATFLAMRRAIENLPCRPIEAWIDGNQIPPGLGIPATSLVKGDAKHLSIACASIVAKVHRDRIMMDMGRAYPEYGFERNMGYGTADHLDAVRQFGPCPIHRRTFAPIRDDGQLCLTLDP
jgi:ribonuclease HII